MFRWVHGSGCLGWMLSVCQALVSALVRAHVQVRLCWLSASDAGAATHGAHRSSEMRAAAEAHLCVPPCRRACRIKAQRLAHEGKPATEIVELGAGPTPDDAYRVRLPAELSMRRALGQRLAGLQRWGWPIPDGSFKLRCSAWSASKLSPGCRRGSLKQPADGLCKGRQNSPSKRVHSAGGHRRMLRRGRARRWRSRCSTAPSSSAAAAAWRTTPMTPRVGGVVYVQLLKRYFMLSLLAGWGDGLEGWLFPLDTRLASLRLDCQLHGLGRGAAE